MAIALAGGAATLRTFAAAALLIYVVAIVIEGWRRLRGQKALPIVLLIGAALLFWSVLGSLERLDGGPEACRGLRCAGVGPWWQSAIAGGATWMLLVHGVMVLLWPVQMGGTHVEIDPLRYAGERQLALRANRLFPDCNVPPAPA